MEPLVEGSADPRGDAEQRGYLYFRAALEHAPVLSLRAAVLERLGCERVALQAAVQALPEFDALRRDGFVHGILSELFGSAPVAGQGDVLRVVSPGDPPTPPHADGEYVRDPRIWTVWIPLGACPPELGGLAVQPRHRDVWASADYACGDVLLFASGTLHRAGENRSDRVRLSADFRYAPSA